MEARATAKFMRVSPRKARLVVDLIRGKNISDAQTVLKLANKGDTTLLGAEAEVIGVDHATMGSWLAQKWELPSVLVESITYHHRPLDVLALERRAHRLGRAMGPALAPASHLLLAAAALHLGLALVTLALDLLPLALRVVALTPLGPLPRLVAVVVAGLRNLHGRAVQLGAVVVGADQRVRADHPRHHHQRQQRRKGIPSGHGCVPFVS